MAAWATGTETVSATLPLVATIRATPFATADTVPDALTVATAGFSDVQVTVDAIGLPRTSRTVAESPRVSPSVVSAEGAEGETVTEAASRLTLSVADPVTDPTLAEIVVDPVAIPVATVVAPEALV